MRKHRLTVKILDQIYSYDTITLLLTLINIMNVQSLISYPGLVGHAESRGWVWYGDFLFQIIFVSWYKSPVSGFT